MAGTRQNSQALYVCLVLIISGGIHVRFFFFLSPGVVLLAILWFAAFLLLLYQAGEEADADEELWDLEHRDPKVLGKFDVVSLPASLCVQQYDSHD